MKSIRSLILTSCVLAFAMTVGCQPPAETVGSADKGDGELHIAVIPKGTTHVFWQSVKYGAEKAGQELGAKVTFRGPQKESDRTEQINVVQGFVNKRVDGICLAPLDATALVGPVKLAMRAKVPVVIFDSGLSTDAENFVSYVATDNFRGGQMAAERMALKLGGKGNVIMLRYNKGSESTHQREEGFLDAIKGHSGINVLSDDQYAGTTTELAVSKAQQLLNRYGDELDGIFAVCEPNAQGVLKALQDQKLTRQVTFVAFDSSEQLRRALVAGEVDSIVLQDPVQMGYLSVKTMIQHIRGETTEGYVDTGVFVATQENMDEEKIAGLLTPELAE